jgi:hypothetical protein
MGTLKVYAANTALVTDYEALKSNVRRFIGRTYDATLGQAGGWVPKAEPSEIPDRAEYRQAIKEGDLTPADRETAAACGLPFAIKKTQSINSI